MKTVKYISVILLLLSISCSNDIELDPVVIPEGSIESTFGMNEYGTIDFKTVEGIEIGVDTSVELEALHGEPEEITQAVDGIVRWQYLSEGIGFGVNTTTDIIDKIYLYSDLYEDYSTSYPRALEENLQFAFGVLKAKHPTLRITDTNGNNWPYEAETLIEATNGAVNGVYSYNFENLGRFIFISDSIDNMEGFVVQIILESVEGNTPQPTQNTWLDIDNSITNLTLSTTCTDCSIATVANPDAADAEATNVTKWTIGSSSGSGNKRLSFDFNEGEALSIADYPNLVITVRMYWPSYNDITNFDGNKRIRLYLSDGNATQQVQGNFVESNEGNWHTMVFDFTGPPSGTAPTSDIISGEIRLIGNNFTNIDNGLDFYIDTITYDIN